MAIAAPNHSEEDLERLINDVLDWQYMHGSLLKIPPDTGKILARPIGVALFPSPFPKHVFEQAMSLQHIYNELYIAVARDEQWLSQVLRNLIEYDSLVGTLWNIHKQVKMHGASVEVSMAFFRSDYMLHNVYDSNGQPLPPQLKQVELNTFSLAGGVHSARISQMHEYFNKTGSYKALPGFSHAIFPPNPTPSSIVHSLFTAHARYGRSKSLNPKRIAILMVVQPNNVNICDERPIEETLWAHDIPTFRVEFGQPVLDATTLSPSSELLFHHSTGDEMFEIAVVYYRAGYDEEEYDPSGIAARVRLEKSKAIKCPSILTHIAGSKRVQQELAMPGVLERFLPAHEAAKIRKTFMPMYPLDESDAGTEGRELARDPATAERYVLKPSKDGGGHNVYGSAIPGYLQSVPQKLWPNYILMERIAPPSDIHNSLISFRGLYSGPVVSELGVFGMCLWEGDEEKGLKIEEMGQGCFSFKSKASHVDEMSVVKGYGCFDSPWLV